MTYIPVNSIAVAAPRSDSPGAATAFATKGFASTAMEEVAAASGITKEIVYRHFASKEELYRAVLEGAAQCTREEFARARHEYESGRHPCAARCRSGAARHPVRCWCTQPASPKLHYARDVRSRVINWVLQRRGTTIRSSTVGLPRWQYRTSAMLSSPGLTSVTQPAMRSLRGAVRWC